MPSDPAAIRHQLITLARRKAARKYDWPRRWHANAVLNPETGQPFGDVGAWEFIADRLEAGHPFEEVIQEDPPDKTAYVMHVQLEEAVLYIKVRLGSGCILGRSFHYSEKVS